MAARPARSDRRTTDDPDPVPGVINSYFTILGRSTYALMPTRSLPL